MKLYLQKDDLLCNYIGESHENFVSLGAAEQVSDA